MDLEEGFTYSLKICTEGGAQKFHILLFQKRRTCKHSYKSFECKREYLADNFRKKL